MNNQAELRSRFVELYGKHSDDFVVKGLFSFYLEDLVRPYQTAMFPERITSTMFTEHNPHLIPGTRNGIPKEGKN
jgi:DNA helicase-2/ATP-dependent DNA helicase PcrA